MTGPPRRLVIKGGTSLPGVIRSERSLAWRSRLLSETPSLQRGQPTGELLCGLGRDGRRKRAVSDGGDVIRRAGLPIPVPRPDCPCRTRPPSTGGEGQELL